MKIGRIGNEAARRWSCEVSETGNENTMPSASTLTMHAKAMAKIMSPEERCVRLDAEIASLRAQLDEAKAKSNWKCKAPGYFGDQDCDWPNCGCDPHAERVISRLRECGFMDPDTVKEFEAETRDEARRKAIEECAIIAEHTWSLGDATAEGHGGEAAGKSIARRIRALLSESKT